MRALILFLCAALSAPAFAETLSHGRFRELTIHRPAREIKQTILYLSGEDGWNDRLDSTARTLAEAGALVVGIDTPDFDRELARDGATCVHPDGDLENLSHFVQAYYKARTYQPAVLIGEASAGALVYAVLAQAPPGLFAGGISVGLCPELRSQTPLCETEQLAFANSNHLHELEAKPLHTPWVALQISMTSACDAVRTRQFVARAHGRAIELDANDELAIQRALLEALHSFAPARTPEHEQSWGERHELPIVELPVASSDTRLAVLISGDGGWAGIDKELAATLTARGMSVIGLDSLRYFWTKRTPQSTADDIDAILRHYLEAWSKRDAVLIGYSQGADVLPFIINRLPSDTRSRVRLVALLGPQQTADFEFHLSDWLGNDENTGLPLLPEVARIEGPIVLCIYGAHEEDSLCPRVPSHVHVIERPGSHHFDGNYARLAELILAQAR